MFVSLINKGGIRGGGEEKEREVLFPFYKLFELISR